MLKLVQMQSFIHVTVHCKLMAIQYQNLMYPVFTKNCTCITVQCKCLAPGIHFLVKLGKFWVPYFHEFAMESNNLMCT